MKNLKMSFGIEIVVSFIIFIAIILLLFIGIKTCFRSPYSLKDLDKITALILVNEKNPLPKNYSTQMKNFQGIAISSIVVPPLTLLLQQAWRENTPLGLLSGYPMVAENLFLKKMNTKSDISNNTSFDRSDEHYTALAIDFNISSKKEEEWLYQHAHEYGFILRYPKGKEEVTKNSYSASHYRFVGIKPAKIMHDEDLCLEEYYEKYGKKEK